MIGFCSVDDIRKRNKVIDADDGVTDDIIETQIGAAEEVIIGDLSGVITYSDLLDAAGSYVLKFLTIYQTMELLLVYIHSQTRQLDETTDVDYWMAKYNEMLQKIIDGVVLISEGGTDYAPTNVPVITSNVSEIFSQRDVDGFDPDYDSNENYDG